ncbi:MAG: hypothetical protein NE330_18740 [Lentisphaeraceae bacterium]|nr:hypothetical protein [Lentisphaeraceae bacterium]
MKKQNFNLVEIIIAMGIVVVCVTTIMGMFSVGMKISRDATINTYANLVFEQLGGFVESIQMLKSKYLQLQQQPPMVFAFQTITATLS